MNNEMATINELSDDILSKIMRYINIGERQRLETVCKRWQSIIRQIWSTKERIFVGIYDEGDFPPNPTRIHNVTRGVSCGLLSFTALKSILELCIGNITELSIIVHTSVVDRPRNTFESLICNRDLECFELYDTSNESMKKCLKCLPTECLKGFGVALENDEFDGESIELIEEIIVKAPGFILLSIGAVSALMLEQIALMSQLKSVYLGKLTFTVAPDELFLNPCKLVHLQWLRIGQDELVDDKFLFAVAKYCQRLELIKFGSKSTTNKGLRAISQLPNLCDVLLSEVEGFELLNFFSNLQELRCDLRPHGPISENVLLDFFLRSPRLGSCRFQDEGIQATFNRIATEAGSTVDFSYAS